MPYKNADHIHDEEYYLYSGIRDETFYPALVGITFPSDYYSISRCPSKVACIEYILEGKGTIHQNNAVFHPQKGDLYILHSNTNQHYYSNPDDPWKKIWINISGTLFEHLLSDYNLDDVIYVKGFNNSSYLYTLFNMIKEDNSVSRDKIAITIHQLFIAISDFIKNNNTQMRPAFIMKQYIDNNLDKPISISDLQALVSFSRTHTINLFKKEFNISPYDYIMNEKLKFAKDLLTNTSLPIGEVASSLSFNDSHHFSNFFKMSTGQTPKQFRKNIV